MLRLYLVVTFLAAAANGFAATLDFLRSPKILTAMARLGVPKPWPPILGILKAAGALGLLVGILVPAIGVAASVGLVLFFCRGHHYAPARARLRS
jgi:DoxX-like family